MKEDPEEQAREAAVREAVRRVLAGDVDAFEIIVRAYERLVASVLRAKMPERDVQDAAQEVFVAAYKGLGTWSGGGLFKSWLMGVARHKADDFMRRHYRRAETLDSEMEEGEFQREEGRAAQAARAAAAAAAAEAEAEAERRGWLDRALERLSAEDREVIRLTELESVKLKDAAAALGCGLAAMKVRAFRARQRLKKALEATRKGEGT